ncbi:hypothetical protein DPSP01_014504 [Paraphaeosphaeria sporulosa]
MENKDAQHLTSKGPGRFFKVPKKYNPYYRAFENRVGVRHQSVKPIRAKFFKAVLGNFAIMQLLFFTLFCYIFGTLYTQNAHVHSIKILYTDYDGGVIGASVRAAYERLKADSYPTLIEVSAVGQTPDVRALQSDVCRRRYWGSIWTHPGASTRLSAALAGGSAAANYDPTDVLTIAWDEARYPTAADSSVLSTLTALSAAARVVYTSINGSGAINTMDRADPNAVGAYSNPWTLGQINIKQTNQGSRAIYNTLCIILILIQEFFYLAALNGMYVAFKIYERLHPHRIVAFRIAISAGYCFVDSLCVTAAIWIFKDGWDVGGGQFMVTWMIVWLFAHVNFLVLDAITVWVPLSFVPLVLITWIVLNVTSILLPFDLVPGLYRWGYALPAHCVYSTQLDIWSGGCNNELHINLPVLFAWELLGLSLSYLGVHRRCHYAVIAQEAQEHQFREKLQAALVFEKKRDTERSKERAHRKDATVGAASADNREGEKEEEAIESAEARDEEDIETELRLQKSMSHAEMKKVQSNVHFGPSFSNPFGSSSDD